MKRKMILFLFAVTVFLLQGRLEVIHAQGSGSAGTIAPEKFVLLAADVWGKNIILQTFELENNQIKTQRSNLIPVVTGNWVIVDAAITFRKENNHLNFDVYYITCQGDWACEETRLSMIRADSNLNYIFGKDLGNLTPSDAQYDLAMQRLKQKSGLSLRLLTGTGAQILEQKLLRSGSLGIPANVGIGGFSSFSAAEDGKMIATASGNPTNLIEIHPFHPTGDKKKIQTEDYIRSMALTGRIVSNSPSVSAGSLPVSNRFLFFMAERLIGRQYHNRVMIQKINDSRVEFIGTPRPFTQFKPAHGRPQEVAISPGGNIVFYTELDTSCNSDILVAQVFDPRTAAKVGPPQTILGCYGQNNYLSGINVTQFQ